MFVLHILTLLTINVHCFVCNNNYLYVYSFLMTAIKSTRGCKLSSLIVFIKEELHSLTMFKCFKNIKLYILPKYMVKKFRF